MSHGFDGEWRHKNCPNITNKVFCKWTKQKESWVLGYIVPEREEDHYQIRQQTWEH